MALPRRFFFRPVFTLTGGAVIVITIVIFVRSLLARNSYEILLSAAALLLLLILAFIGSWKSQKLKLLEAGWKLPFPMTANAGENSVVTGLDTHIPLFFRLHFVVRGRFFPAGVSVGASAGCPVLAETSASRGEDTARLSLDFPVSGIFQGEGFCRLRDIFGFFSFSCGIPQHRTVKVRSAPCFAKNYHINAQSGAEDRRSKHSSDEERYYMREYTPGDRFRDINWKSSDKIDTLITRISPDNQEKVSKIEVYFRNYGPANKVSLQAFWLLDRAKARLSHFLRNLQEQQSSYIFHVRAAQGNWVIEDTEDLDAFLEELAGLPFSPPRNEEISHANAGELYVFSTACDAGLSGFLLAYNPRPVSLFLVQPTEKKTAAVTEPEKLYISSFPAMGCIPLPQWFSGRKVRQLGAHANRVEMIYAETRL
ncbi:MAG: DUF58 domain-containing protein [Spirochaetes bacterium]|nr:DUF58 domain-containing protein [Spirochaetota bacterium]